MTTKTLELLFQSADGKTVRIPINDPKEPVDTVQVNTVMDLIITKNIFQFAGGILTAKVGARLVENTVTDLTL